MKKMSDNESPYSEYKVEVMLDEKQIHATWVIKNTKKDKVIRRGTWFIVELRDIEESQKTIRKLQEEGISYLVSYVTLLETLNEMNSIPTENLVASHNLRKFKEPTENKKKHPENTASYTQQINAAPHTGISAALEDACSNPKTKKYMDELTNLFKGMIDESKMKETKKAKGCK
jgi:hypothetical protein